MNRRNFVLSWGRKIFFGFAWPLMSLFALVYFNSSYIPKSFLEWLYYGTHFLGHFGLVTCVLYFVLFIPVVLIFPTYYVSRFWSYFLIITVQLLLMFDLSVYMQFGQHLNPLMLQIIVDHGGSFLIGQSFPSIVGFFLIWLAITATFWFRGAQLWRSMQKRFSNPVSNWYLVVILICQITSYLILNYSHLRLSSVFPLEWSKFVMSLIKDKPIQSDPVLKNLKYPAAKLTCSVKNKMNVLLVAVNNWSAEAFDKTQDPFVYHLGSHGAFFENHYSGGSNAEAGLFSLLYGIPVNYITTVNEKQLRPVVMDELVNLGYQGAIISDMAPSFPISDNISAIKVGSGEDRNLQVAEAWKNWNSGRSSEKSFFATLVFNHDSSFNQSMTSVVQDLFHKGLLSQTILIITGTNGKSFIEGQEHFITNNQVKVPFIMIWPGKKLKSSQLVSSHYDLAPTLTKELWNCKNRSSDLSLGKSLLELPSERNLVVGDFNSFAIFDTKNQQVINVEDTFYHVADFSMKKLSRTKAHRDVLLQGLKDISYFYRRQ